MDHNHIGSSVSSVGYVTKLSAKKRAGEVVIRLSKLYPDPMPALDYKTPWELLVATVLAAQCTDARVNIVTPHLFERWPGPKELAEADTADLEQVIRSTGFFRQKSKNLIASAKRVTHEWDGQLPRNMADLTSLPGVARKTANIVLSNAFGIHDGIAVDTHVKRISNRLGFTVSDNPVVIEKDLMPLIERERWGDFNHYLVLYGRSVCKARKPLCSDCVLDDICPKVGLTQKQ